MPNGDESRSDAREINLETHPLVDKLHPNPDEIHDIVALVGYLGPSRKDGCVRLYSDLTFRNYYEIPTSGILATAPTDAGDENSPTSVHVSADTRLEAVSISSQSIEASYLKGSISSGYLGSAGAGAQTVGTIPSLVTMINCGPAKTVGCCVGEGAQAAQPAAAQAANVVTGYTDNSCWGSCYWTCAAAGAQAGQAVNAGAQMTLSCWGTCYPTTCGEKGAQAANAAMGYAGVTWWCVTMACGGMLAAHPAAQAVGTFPTVTQINCGPAQTVMCGP